jgi:hypothetical protein
MIAMVTLRNMITKIKTFKTIFDANSVLDLLAHRENFDNRFAQTALFLRNSLNRFFPTVAFQRVNCFRKALS